MLGALGRWCVSTPKHSEVVKAAAGEADISECFLIAADTLGVHCLLSQSL